MAIDSEVALARAVLIHGPVSRSALTSRLSLSPASLTRLAKPLLDSGVLVELDDVVDGSIGRPSRPLDIAPDIATFVGVKLTGDRLYAVATTIRAEPLAWFEEPITDPSPDAVVALVVRIVRSLGATDLSGVGVSVGGYVRDDLISFAPFLGWTDVDLVSPLVAALAVPVTVDNDVAALAEAERWFGVGRELDGFAVITIGVGVGYGLVVDGQVVRTADAGTGTGGHIPLSPNGPVCPEGHRGCSRAFLTSGSIAAQVSAALGRTIDYDDVLELAAAGQPAARTVVDAAGDALGTLIALAANLTLQSSVVLAGEGIGLYELVADRVAAAIDAGRDRRAEPVTVYPDTAGFPAWARGAAAVAIQQALLRIAAGRRRRGA
ncbi:ROK family protein [Microbacterium sp.]|uniref:ROK family protein n=1 Tax=Microbacterium sp. TaxID=51671 RepID=UPI003C707976